MTPIYVLEPARELFMCPLTEVMSIVKDVRVGRQKMRRASLLWVNAHVATHLYTQRTMPESPRES